MTKIGINYEPPIADFIEKALKKKLVTAIEIIPDFFSHHRVDELSALLRRYDVPYSFHFIGNSLGSADFQQNNSISAHSKMIRLLAPIHYSDHLTCCRSGKIDLQQNLAFPRTEDMVDLFVENIKFMKKKIGARKKLLLENIAQDESSLNSQLSHSNFYKKIIEKSDSFILLDVHNLYADELNGGIDPIEFIESIPPELIREVHVSGGSWTRTGKSYLDSHDSRTPRRVFELLEFVMKRAEPELIVFERITRLALTPNQLNRLTSEISRDLAYINTINSRWARKRGTSSKVPLTAETRRKIQIEQSRHLKSLITENKSPLRKSEPAQAVERKYLRSVRKAIECFFPVFSARETLTDKELAFMFGGLAVHLDDLRALQEIFQVLYRNKKLSNSQGVRELLLIERALAGSAIVAPTAYPHRQIMSKAERISFGQEKYQDKEGMFFVSLTTDFATDYPRLRRGDGKPLENRTALVVIYADKRRQPQMFIKYRKV